MEEAGRGVLYARVNFSNSFCPIIRKGRQRTSYFYIYNPRDSLPGILHGLILGSEGVVSSVLGTMPVLRVFKQLFFSNSFSLY
jgi:hypothetical protein